MLERVQNAILIVISHSDLPPPSLPLSLLPPPLLSFSLAVLAQAAQK